MSMSLHGKDKGMHPRSAERPREERDPFSLQEENRRLTYEVIAEKIEQDPALLNIPLANIERWLAQGHPSVGPLTEWKARIELAQRSPDAMAALLDLLRGFSPEAMRLKGHSPFAGILTSAELSMA
jgi:hypothetical protein